MDVPTTYRSHRDPLIGSFEPDVADLVRWLEGGEPDAVCGIAEDSLRCPLAEYLGQVLHCRIAVGKLTFAVTNSQFESTPLPRWAREFVVLVDEWSGTVTFARARASLDSARQIVADEASNDA